MVQLYRGAIAKIQGVIPVDILDERTDGDGNRIYKTSVDWYKGYYVNVGGDKELHLTVVVKEPK